MSTTKPSSFSFELRPAVPEDSADIVAFLNAIGKESDFTTIDPSEGFWMTEEEESKIIRDIRDKKKRGAIILATEKESGLVIGTSTAFGEERLMSHVFTMGVSVRRDFWGAGVGRALFERAMREARDLGAEKLELGVCDHNTRAIRMYERAGFVREGVRRRVFKNHRGKYHDDIMMAYFFHEEEEKSGGEKS